MQDKSGYKFPGYNVLGYGWNVLADTPRLAKKTRLVEDPRAERTTIIGEVSPLYFVMQESKTHYETEIANSLSSFEQKRIISTSVAVDNWGFEGEVSTKFGSEAKGSNSVYLANVKRIGTEYLVAFQNKEPEDIKSHLREKFKIKLNDPKFSPEKLFKKYGTHLVTKITLGGRLDYWMSSTDVESMSYSEFEASVKAAYQGVSAEVGAEGSTKTGSKISALNMQIDAVGGDQGKIEAVKNEKTPSAFADWASTIKDDPYCIGQSLTPLWKMCDDQTRADQLEREFKHQRAAFKLRHLVVFSRTWMPATKPQQPGRDQDHTLEIPKEYKILSGGAEVVAVPGVERSGYHLFKASYPKSSNQWRAWSACHLWKDKWKEERERDAALVISVLAIYDPNEEHDWEVTISEPHAVPKSGLVAEGSTSLPRVPSGHLTGGGTEMTNPSGWGGVIRASTPIQEKAGKGIVWHARVQEHVETGTADLNVYDIRIAPAADVRWELESKLFNKKGTNGQGSAVNLGVPRDFIFVGGGVQSGTTDTFPFRSVPRTSAYGTTEWFGLTGQYWTKAFGSVEVNTVGLKLKSVKSP